jgi:hypothetical protein
MKSNAKYMKNGENAGGFKGGAVFDTKEEAERYLADKRKGKVPSSYLSGQYPGFATGGYTGKWGSEGKLAILHEKELVLNKEDTANILAAVKSTRASSGMNINSDYLAGISHSVDNIYDAVMRLLEVTSASLNTSLNAAGTVANTQSNVSNTINANFPNAGNMNEIQNALMNLTNYTSQRLHSNQRGKSGTAQSSTYRTKSF